MLYQLNYWPTQKLPLHLFVQGVLTAKATVLVELELRRLLFFVAPSSVIPLLAFRALKVNDIPSH